MMGGPRAGAGANGGADSARCLATDVSSGVVYLVTATALLEVRRVQVEHIRLTLG